MTSAAKQMFEGVGAPVKVSNNDDDGYIMDPTLDSCCQREVRLMLKIKMMADHDHVSCVMSLVWSLGIVTSRYLFIYLTCCILLFHSILFYSTVM